MQITISTTIPTTQHTPYPPRITHKISILWTTLAVSCLSLVLTAPAIAAMQSAEDSDHHEHSLHHEHTENHEHTEEHNHTDHLYEQHHGQSKLNSQNVKGYGHVSKLDLSKVADVPEHIRNKTQIAISNYPLFLISEAVTQGAPSGKLLLNAGSVGHHGSLSPTGFKTVKDSRYVVWFGEALESNLVKPLSKSNNTISLFKLNAFNRLPLRDVQGQKIEGTMDPHIWLDPENAKAIARALGAIYSRANPQYKETYLQNVQKFSSDMNAAVAKVKSNGINQKPYWAYHDAYGYIEPTLNLKMIGALTADHHLSPKAGQYHWLKQNKPHEKMCMILQSSNNDGALAKLGPVVSTVQQEDMSDATDFVSGWLNLGKDINACINQSG